MTRFVDITIQRETIVKDVCRVVHELFPTWPIDRIQTKELHGGLVNAMYKASLKPEVISTADTNSPKAESKDGNGRANEQPELIIRVYNFKMDHIKLGKNLQETFEQAAKLDEEASKQTTAPVAPSADSNQSNESETKKDANNNDNDNPSKAGVQTTEIRFDKVMFDRIYELEVYETLNKHGLCSTVYGRFANGLCYEFAQGNILTPEVMQTDDFVQQITEILAKFHLVPMGKPQHTPFSTMFEKMKTTMLPMFTVFMPEIQAGIDRSTLKEYKNYPKVEWLRLEALKLDDKLAAIGFGDVGFCHNDLNPTNGVWNEETKQLHLIDFELSMPNYLCMEVGSHFACCCGHLLYDFRSSRLPNAEFRLKWIRKYLTKRLQLLNRTLAPQEFEQEVWNLHRRSSLSLLTMFVRFALICPFFDFKREIFLSEEISDKLKQTPNALALSGSEAAKAYFDNRDALMKIVDQEHPENTDL